MDQLFYIPASMIWPLLACLVITGIHVYLGVHVIARKVIFVDLALAQIAALGTVTAVLLGYEVGKDILPLYLYSLAYTVFGAFIFSVTRMRGEKVPHEAIIGIVYAVTFAMTILVLSRSALGPQELDHLIKGELLWVQAPIVIRTLIIYILVGLFHFAFRKKFMAISFDPQGAEQSGINVRLWDFLFYMSFGVVITSSVAIAGVFLVFSYLVIPSVGAMLVSDKLSTRLITGWIGSSVISFIGVKLSWQTGLPTSPLIVVIFALFLLLSGMTRYLRVSPSKTVAFRNLGASFIVIALFASAVFLSRKHEEDPLEHNLHMLKSPLSTDRVTAIMNLAGYLDKKSEWLPMLIEGVKDQDADVRKTAITFLTKLDEKSAVQAIMTRLDDKSDDVKGAAIDAVRKLGSPDNSTILIQMAQKEEDPELQVSLLEAALTMGNSDAIPLFIKIIEENGLFADDAYDKLHGHLSFDFKRDESGRIKLWWEANRNKLVWNENSKTFLIK